jgi:hypothetical protein
VRRGRRHIIPVADDSASAGRAGILHLRSFDSDGTPFALKALSMTSEEDNSSRLFAEL